MRFAPLALLPLTLLLRADGCFVDDGFGFAGAFPATTETTVEKKLTLHLDGQQPQVRFVMPLTMTPASSSAHVDVLVTRATRRVGIECAEEEFATDERSRWFGIDVNGSTSTFLTPREQTALRLSVGLGEDDIALTDPTASVDVDLVVTFAEPTDVDFDGADDGVVLDIGTLEPLP